MILLSLGFTYLMIKLVIELMKEEDRKHKIKVEQDRRRAELRDALRSHARMR